MHVHPAALRLAALRKHCILVTDAVAVDVDYFGQRAVERDGAAYLENGTLTGSTLTMDRAVRNVQALVGLPRARGHGDAHAGPGRGHRQLRVAGHRGPRRISSPWTAPSLEVVGVWLAGEPAYARPGDR